MKYLYVTDGGDTYKQTSDEPTQEDLKEVQEGHIAILSFEPSRGFCLAMVDEVEKDDDDEEEEAEAELGIVDWERVEIFKTK